MTDLTAQTPVEIDTALAALYDIEAGLRADSVNVRARAFSTADRREVDSKPSHWDRNPHPTATMDEVLALLRAQAASGSYDADYAVRALKAYDDNKAALAANTAAQEPLHAEYRRRGGWTRAFLVLSSNGHVHSSMDCSTCFYARWDYQTGLYKPGTQYGWLPSLSGHDEAEIVDAAGADACTVCYPSAPVESLGRPRRVRHHTEEAAAAARAQKAAEKAERDAKKAAKALVLDLRPLGVDGYVGRIETLAAAKMYLTDSFMWNRNGTHPSYPAVAVEHVAQAVAEKVGTTPVEEMAAAAKRYAKRR